MDRYEFLHILGEQIRVKRARPMVIKEIANHIEDQKCAFLAEGMTAREAEEAAVREMGDPVETGIALDRIHRPKMEWSVLGGVVFISLLGLLLQTVITMASYPSGMDNRLLAVWNGGVGRHVMFMTAGIAVMLLICLVDYSVIKKYAVPLFMAVNVCMAACIVFAPVVNGRPQYLAPVSYILIPFYAGVLYHFRGEGQKGLLKSIFCMGISVVILFYNFMLSSIFIVGVTGLVLLHVAIVKGWFGNRKKLLYMELWGILLLVAVCFGTLIVWKTGGDLLAGYQADRIREWLHPGENGVYYTLRAAAGQAGEFMAAERTGDGLVENFMLEIRSSYMWIYLFGYLGTVKGLLLMAAVIGFWLLVFRAVHRQTNQLGYMISLGCVLFLSMESLLYIGMNFRVIPEGSSFMPFLSSGGTFLLVSYFYMGLLLSVCRNGRLVEN